MNKKVLSYLYIALSILFIIFIAIPNFLRYSDITAFLVLAGLIFGLGQTYYLLFVRKISK